MNEREQSIYDAGELLLSDRLANNIRAIEQEFQDDPETCCVSFLCAMENLLERTAMAQEQGGKGPIRHICISFLQSSMLTGSYQLRIDAYDDRYFADMTYTYAYWSPDFIFRYFDDDMAFFRRHISQIIIRIREYEIMTFAGRYIMHYIRIVQQLVHDLIQQMALPEEVTITFGGYMDKAIVLTGRSEAAG